jgi:hypothetical protein
MAEGLMTSPPVAPTGVPAQQYGGGMDPSPPAPPTEQQAGQQAGRGRMKKRGKLWKQGQGGMLGRANWKEREFVLTANPTQLSYFDCGLNFLRKKGSLDFAGPAKVERLLHALKTGTSGSTEWRFAVTCGSRTLNMAANSEGEMHEWIDALCEVLGQTSCAAPKAAASHGGEEGKELHTSAQMPTAAASGGGGGAAFDNNTPAEGSPPARLRTLKGGSAGNMTEREMLRTSCTCGKPASHCACGLDGMTSPPARPSGRFDPKTGRPIPVGGGGAAVSQYASLKRGQMQAAAQNDGEL